MVVSSVVNGTVDVNSEISSGVEMQKNTLISRQLFGSQYNTMSINCSWSALNTSLTVTSVSDGSLAVGQILKGTGITTDTKIVEQLTKGVVFTAIWNASGSELIVTNISSGLLAVGQEIFGEGIMYGSKIVSQTAGSPGRTGTYLLSDFRGASFTAIWTASSDLINVTKVSSGRLAAGQGIFSSGLHM